MVFLVGTSEADQRGTPWAIRAPGRGRDRRTPSAEGRTQPPSSMPQFAGPTPDQSARDHPEDRAYVPAAISTTPHNAITTPTRCTPRTRSPSSSAASTTVVTGYSELATATLDSSPIVEAWL